MATCLNCKTIIPDGRRYCDSHYRYELAKYERNIKNYPIALQKYNERLKEYNSLSSEQKKALHLENIKEVEKANIQAEKKDLRSYTTLFAVIIGIILGSMYRSWIVFLASSILLGGLFITLNLQKYMRAILISIGFFLMFLFSKKILFYFFHSLSDNNFINWILLALGIFIGFFLEMNGHNRASTGMVALDGSPIKPIQPSPPTP